MIHPDVCQNRRFLKVVVYKSSLVTYFHKISLMFLNASARSDQPAAQQHRYHDIFLSTLSTAQTPLKSFQWSRSCTGFVCRWSTQAQRCSHASQSASCQKHADDHFSSVCCCLVLTVVWYLSRVAAPRSEICQRSLAALS